jgi:hypothetical protein
MSDLVLEAPSLSRVFTPAPSGWRSWFKSRKRTYRLNHAYQYAGQHCGVVTVPEGFEFDGASIPRVAWRIIGTPFAPDVVIGGLVHDYLYKNGYKIGISRKDSDKTFREISILEQHSRAHVMYRTLRMLGARNYKD